MALVPHSPFLSPLKPINSKSSLSTAFKNFKISSSLGPSNANQSSPQEEPQEAENDAIKLAFAKAKAYKKALKSDPTPQIVDTLVQESDEIDENSYGSVSDDEENMNDEVPLAVKLALLKAKEYKKNNDFVGASNSILEDGESLSGVKKGNSGSPLSELLKRSADANQESSSEGLKSDGKGNADQEVPLAVKLALEKAKKYKEKKGVVDSDKPDKGTEETSGLERRVRIDPGSTLSENKEKKKEEFKVSNIDFVGLNFSDKKQSRGLPAGLVPVADPFPEGDLPEVEIVVGDASKFGGGAKTEFPSQEDNLDIYKPKVSTWGVFPRPGNISKTYGGGRNIRPGDVLETAEDKAAKQARTRQLIAAYNSKIGLNIDPKLKSECEKALNDGDSLMDLGRLEEALPFYEKIMEKLTFQSELHGLAALQWSICQDSLTRRNEARVMYEKLQSHPNPQVSKKARQFVFGFQAMEMMKVTSSTRSPASMGYQSYFEAFVRDKVNYSFKDSEDDEGALTQALPYILFLVSPILIILIIAVQKRV